MASLPFAALSHRSLPLLSGLDLTSLYVQPSMIFRFHHLASCPRLQASRRTSAFSQDNGNLADDPRDWSRINGFVVPDLGVGDEDEEDGVEEDEDEDDDEEEEDRSLDLLVRFVQNVFRKASRKARKAVRSVLPLSVPTKLVRFSVNGTIILAFLWILKAFLEVVCTMGSIIFACILFIRGIWSWITYFQEIRLRRMNELDDVWTGARPVS